MPLTLTSTSEIFIAMTHHERFLAPNLISTNPKSSAEDLARDIFGATNLSYLHDDDAINWHCVSRDTRAKGCSFMMLFLVHKRV